MPNQKEIDTIFDKLMEQEIIINGLVKVIYRATQVLIAEESIPFARRMEVMNTISDETSQALDAWLEKKGGKDKPDESSPPEVA